MLILIFQANYKTFLIFLFQVSIPFRRQARICIGRQPFKTIEKNILSQLISYDDVTCIFNCDVTYNKVKFCGLEMHMKKISKTLEENLWRNAVEEEKTSQNNLNRNLQKKISACKCNNNETCVVVKFEPFIYYCTILQINVIDLVF